MNETSDTRESFTGFEECVSYTSTPTEVLQAEVRKDLFDNFAAAVVGYGFSGIDAAVEAALQVYLDELGKVAKGSRENTGLMLPEPDVTEGGLRGLAAPVPVSLGMVRLLTDKMSKHVRYAMGTKPHIRLQGYPDGTIPGGLAGDSSRIRFVDCSGFACYVIAKATDQAWILRSGSAQQQEDCAGLGLQQVPYDSVAQGGADDLFIAFIRKIGSGHVWLVNEGRTMESCGERGVGRRRWDTPALKRQATHCYQLPTRG